MNLIKSNLLSENECSAFDFFLQPNLVEGQINDAVEKYLLN